MTLSSEVTRVDAVGDDSTVEFFFNFKTLSTAHVKVFLDSVEQGTGYSVALNEDQESSPGGSVTFLDPPAVAVAVRVQRSMPRTQTTDFSPFAAVRATTLEASLDAIVMQVQEVDAAGTDYTDERETVLRADFNVLENAASTLADAQASAAGAMGSAFAALTQAGLAAASAGAASGSASTADAARIAHLVELAVDFCTRQLKPDGVLVAKLFHGSGYSQLVELFKRTFRVVKPIKPKASRDRSSETFLVGIGLKKS